MVRTTEIKAGPGCHNAVAKVLTQGGLAVESDVLSFCLGCLTGSKCGDRVDLS